MKRGDKIIDSDVEYFDILFTLGLLDDDDDYELWLLQEKNQPNVDDVWAIYVIINHQTNKRNTHEDRIFY